MKKRGMNKLFVFIIIITFGISLFSLLQPTSANHTIKVGYIDYPGFLEKSSSGQYVGYGAKYLEEVSQYTNWDYEFVLDSWDNCLEKLKTGEIDLLCTAQYTDERTQYYDYSQYSIGDEYTIVYTREDENIYYQDYEAMNHCKIGFLSGSYQNGVWEKYAKEHSIEYKSQYYTTETDVLNALYNKDVDMVVVGGLALHENVKVIDKFNAKPYYFITAKNRQDIMEPLNDALSQIYNRNPYFNAYLYEEFYSTSAYSTQPLFTRNEVEYIKNVQSIPVGIEDELYPFSYDDDQQRKGIFIELLEKMSEKSGLSFKPNYFLEKEKNKATFIEQLQNKDALFMGVTKDEYSFHMKSQYHISKSFLDVNQVMIARKNEVFDNQYTIALTKNHTGYESQVYSKYPDAKVLYCENMNACLKAVYSGKANMTIGDAYSVKYYIQKLGFEDTLDIYNILLEPIQLCFVGQLDNNPVLMNIIDKTIDSLSNKEIERIVQTYTVGLKYEYSLLDTIYQNRTSITFVALVIIIILVIIGQSIKKRTELFMQKRETEILREKAELDRLTGIYNQSTFYEKAREILNQNEEDFCLIYMNINRFQVINDLYGIEEGDRLLAYIGKYLKDYMNNHSHTLVCRLTTDHFLILTTQSEYKKNKKIDILKDYPLDFNSALRFGIYFIEDKSLSVHIMADRAAMAAKSIKNRYINQAEVYNEEQRQIILQEQMIMDEIQTAILQEDILIYVQPKYDIENNMIIGGEALVRWLHPKHGLISPSVFIPVLEKNGLITQLDDFVWEKTCQLLRELKNMHCLLPISINISRLNFYRNHLPLLLLDLVHKYELQPQDLHLEITESVYSKDTEVIYSVIEELQQLGFVILMDDFGSGYSSLSMLKDAPVDIIKLDMGFLSLKDDMKRSYAIIEAIVDLSYTLDLSLIVEGVETKEQVAFLQKIHAQYAQGYYFSKPVPVKDYINLCLENH